ncbi:MAG TPA: acyltransferase [Microthrixaceae bacterium]|nr:acyltransferase [Microthrixaceae bacterium]
MEGQGTGGGVRLRSLDALRGIAATCVLVYHFTAGFDLDGFFPGYDQAVVRFSGGRFGVQLFFVISGFVILWSFQRVKGVGDFAYSRFSRLYPPYWGSMVIVTAFILVFQQFLEGPGIDDVHFTPGQWLLNLTMIPTWLGSEVLAGVYWTLAVEMGFYLIAGLAFVLGLLKPERVLWTLVGAWVFDVVIGGMMVLANGQSLETMAQDYATLFIAGMALFTLYQRPQEHRWIKLFLIFSIPFVDLARGAMWQGIVSALIAVTMYLAVFGHLRVLETRPLLWLGAISYSLYLVHEVPGYLTMKWLLEAGWNRNLVVGVVIAQSLVLAVALNKAVEVPATRWLRERRKRRVAQASVASA